MRATIFGPPGRERVEHFAAGLRLHGVQVEYRSRHSYRPAPLAIMWAHKNPTVITGQRIRSLPYLVLEMGYFRDRNQFTSAGFNGLNGRADFQNARSPADRWEKHGVELKPWREDGDYTLVMGQVPRDAALALCKDYPTWVATACRQAKAYGKPVLFRPHPKAPQVRAPAPTFVGTLDEALSGAHAVVTWNSNSATDAVIAGVPVVTCDRGAMTWELAAHTVGAPLRRLDRTQWAHNLAYAQWTAAEMESGETWAHLKRRFAAPVEQVAA